MTTNKDNVVTLAKGKTIKKTTITRKNTAEKKDAATKAKERVGELLSDVDLNVDKEKESFELIEKKEIANPNNIEWLEEQVDILTKENQKLNNKLANAANKDIKENVILLFHEFQGEYLKHPVETRTHTTIFLIALLEKMFAKFSFLAEHKRT